jgi:hypothetical protein
MKKLNILILMLLLFGGAVRGQVETPDYSKLNSIVHPPQNMLFSPNGTNSNIVTVNGFDNYFLGVDFGEPYVSSNPRDPLNAICAWNINNLYYTLNGYNWIKNNPPFPGFSLVGDPVMTYDSLGNAYYAQLYQNGSIYGLAVTKSTDKGQTWINATSVASTSAGLSDKEWITADQTGGPFSNNVYIGWRQFGSTGMRFSRSTNGGTAWSSPITLSGDQGAYVAVGPNGNISGGSVYFAATLGSYIICYRSTDGGATFGTYVIASPFIQGPGTVCYGRYTVKNCIRTDYFPRMAVDNSYTSTRGNVYIVYAGNPMNSTSDKADVFLVRSTDNGQTFGPALRVNDDNTYTDQWMPAVSVDKQGKVFVSWYDSRIDPSANLLTQFYGAVSTNGGVSFLPNSPISNVSFNPNNMAQGQGSNQANYIGDYVGNSPTGNSSWQVWMDARGSSLGSYAAYYPDFAMQTASSLSIKNNDSATITVKIPAVNGPFTGRVKFTTSMDTIPASGTLSYNFTGGKDSLVTYPDSLYLKIKASGSVTPGTYTLKIIGTGVNNSPVHLRTVTLHVNQSLLSIGTNREGVLAFKLNGAQYTQRQSVYLPTGGQVSVQAISPQTFGGTRYIYQNWSDGGDTAHTFTLNAPLTLTTNFKTQFKLLVNSSIGNTFGNNTFTDSAGAVNFGVLSRYFYYNGETYKFRGWTGSGNNSYTSPDSTGLDTNIIITPVSGILVETARWTISTAITQLGTEIPAEFRLGQNYPNPFNPSTLIEYDIKENSFVTIKIYDMLGREVNTLVNENMQAGRYRTTFNISNMNLSSGIYYYKMNAGTFSDIRKMVLIK